MPMREMCKQVMKLFYGIILSPIKRDRVYTYQCPLSLSKTLGLHLLILIIVDLHLLRILPDI
jgi:hypothetical protein